MEAPNLGDELHHFGWNACSSALCPYAPHPHVERRYLLVPGLRSSRIYVFDVKPDPRKPKLVHTIQPEEIASRAGYSRPHTIHCGPDGIYVSALAARRRRTGRNFPARPRKLRCRRAAGSSIAVRRSSPTTSGGISVTTPQSPASGARRTWSKTGSTPRSCWPAATATSSTSGTSPSGATSRRSTSARRIRWCSSCARRTTRPRPMALSASSPA